MTNQKNKKIDGVKKVDEKKKKKSREIVLKSINEEIKKQSEVQISSNLKKIDGILIGKKIKQTVEGMKKIPSKKIVKKLAKNNKKIIDDVKLDTNRAVEIKKEDVKDEIIPVDDQVAEKPEKNVVDKYFDNKNEEWEKEQDEKKKVEAEKAKLEEDKKRKKQKELFKKEMMNIFSAPDELNEDDAQVVLDKEKNKEEKVEKEQAKKDAAKKIEEERKRKEVVMEAREKAREEANAEKEKAEKELEKERKKEEALEKAKREKKLKAEKARKEKEEKERIKKEKIIAAEQKKKEETANKKEKERQKVKEEKEKAIKKKKKEEEKKKRKIERKKIRKEKLKKLKLNFKGYCLKFSKRIIYVLSISLLSGIMLYAVATMFVVKLGVQNSLLYKAAKYFPVPAMITDYGYLDYFSYMQFKELYKDYDAGKIKIEIARSLILNKMLDKYDLPKNESGIELLEKMMIDDDDVNQVGINRINKLKSLIDEEGDFIKLSEKYGDVLSQINLSESNKSQYSYGDQVIDMQTGEISEVIKTKEGYYIFKCFSREINEVKLSYVFIKAKSLNEFINEKIEGFKIWSLVD